jgi:hypothetical protein
MMGEKDGESGQQTENTEGLEARERKCSALEGFIVCIVFLG